MTGNVVDLFVGQRKRAENDLQEENSGQTKANTL